MNEIEIFVQGENIPEIKLVRVSTTDSVRSILAIMPTQGVRSVESEQPFVLLEDGEEPLALDKSFSEVGVGQRSRLHIHRCRRIEVSVNFNGTQKERIFAPSTTLHRVTIWAVREFGLSKRDATEHALQICGTATRPDEDTHIGSLVRCSDCAVCFDLVPKQRVEGHCDASR